MTMTSLSQQHIDRVVRETRCDAAVEGEVPDNDIIKQSWRRCVQQHNLDPEHPEPARILPAQEVLEHKDQIDEFLHVARIGMEAFYKHVANLDYVLLLADAEGITVDFIGDKKHDKSLKKAGLYLGSDWNEAHAGTNGVGTCLRTAESLICHQTDHFHATHINLTCTAAPVFDPNGDLLAVLDVSALKSPTPREGQFLVSQLAAMYAKRVECVNFFRHFENHWIVRFANTPEFVDVTTDNLLAIDGDGKVLGATQSAAEALKSNATVKSIVGGLATDFFECSLDKLFAEPAKADMSSKRMLITRERHELYYATLIEPRGLSRTTPQPDADGRDYGALEKLTNKDRLMERVIKRAKRLLDQHVNIIIGGETGTGKEVMARALHESSHRTDKPFVAVNCAAIPESLIESELFGYKSGSFTGALSRGMKGLIMQSNGGTLFLDEIGDMPVQLQSRLLRVLAEKEVTAVGGSKPEPVDLHVISASHHDLRVLIAEGIFREDLYYRLNGAILNLPPLRDREDKGYITSKILAEESSSRNLSFQISHGAMQLILGYSWPGNVRQLRNAIQFALAVCEDGVIAVEDLPDEILESAIKSPALKQLVSEPDPVIVATPENGDYPPKIKQLVEALRLYKWNITAVSNELGVSRSTIYRRMERYGIVPPNLI